MAFLTAPIDSFSQHIEAIQKIPCLSATPELLKGLVELRGDTRIDKICAKNEVDQEIQRINESQEMERMQADLIALPELDTKETAKNEAGDLVYLHLGGESLFGNGESIAQSLRGFESNTTSTKRKISNEEQGRPELLHIQSIQELKGEEPGTLSVPFNVLLGQATQPRRKKKRRKVPMSQTSRCCLFW